MEAKTIIQTRQQLERLKNFQKKNASSRFAMAGYIVELLVGASLLAGNVFRENYSSVMWAGWVLFFLGLLLFSQGLYLIFRHYYDKRFIKILEQVLNEPNEQNSIT
jgi:uncharacterized membrane protein YgdD (TMEM256/DUF423 family)